MYSTQSTFNATYSEAQIPSLSEVWAKKYVANLDIRDQELSQREEISCRADAANKLRSSLRSVSAQAWNKTEALLKYEVEYEVERHDIDPALIDPWQVSKDIHQIFEIAVAAYADDISPERLSVKLSAEVGEIRKRHTAVDPRVIGFVSMQFHYSGQLLSQEVSTDEAARVQQYFKVIDDHLYMPLQRAYEAAANYSYDHPRLKTAQALLPHCTTIAQSIVNRVNQLYPNYVCHSGRLDSAAVRISSVRDVEMFQIYLLTCVLEKNIAAITQELFPLCVMLYPTLNVNWELVRQMINLMERGLQQYVTPEQASYYQPYYQALWKLFSPEVFPETVPMSEAS